MEKYSAEYVCDRFELSEKDNAAVGTKEYSYLINEDNVNEWMFDMVHSLYELAECCCDNVNVWMFLIDKDEWVRILIKTPYTTYFMDSMPFDDAAKYAQSVGEDMGAYYIAVYQSDCGEDRVYKLAARETYWDRFLVDEWVTINNACGSYDDLDRSLINFGEYMKDATPWQTDLESEIYAISKKLPVNQSILVGPIDDLYELYGKSGTKKANYLCWTDVGEYKSIEWKFPDGNRGSIMWEE